MSYTAHMVQHLVLAQLVPIALLLAWRERPRIIVSAAVSWLLGVGVMIVTALPPAYHAADAHAAVAWACRVALVATGLLFWARVVPATRVRVLEPGASIVYLVTACFATTLAGVYVAFAATTRDQQVAGLVMWVPCCIVFLSASLAVIGRALAGAAAVQHPSE